MAPNLRLWEAEDWISNGSGRRRRPNVPPPPRATHSTGTCWSSSQQPLTSLPNFGFFIPNGSFKGIYFILDCVGSDAVFSQCNFFWKNIWVYPLGFYPGEAALNWLFPAVSRRERDDAGWRWRHSLRHECHHLCLSNIDIYWLRWLRFAGEPIRNIGIYPESHVQVLFFVDITHMF
jgi:hypothetical protein